jgi:putative intracellular protease/amidase
MTKRVLVPIADGSEEIETTCIQDTLVRCGAEVIVASVMKDQLTCKMSRGIKVGELPMHFLNRLETVGRRCAHIFCH